MGDPLESPHRRLNPLTREWVLVSPHRAKRPWLGQVEKIAPATRPAYDPGCYLCPGNERAGGHRNPAYQGTFVFENDFAALLPDAAARPSHSHELLRAEPERGICRVVCFSADHSASVPALSVDELSQVVETWIEQYVSLGAIDWVNHVQVFENRGEMMGASNPHPHCQIWANATVPGEMAKELASFRAYQERRECCLLCDYVQVEQGERVRIVEENESFLALVPFWAVWPFETLLVSKRHVTAMVELSSPERRALADIMQRLTARYDRLFDTAFPYSMGFHQAPTDGADHSAFHFHAHYYPPLLRSATVRKFMVGYEMLGNPQRDITAEIAAARLREV